MSTSKTSSKGSRVTQQKKKNFAGRHADSTTCTVDDFDLKRHVNGNRVDPVEGRETRLPIVIRGMRNNKSIREIAFECDVVPSTIANDKKFILSEAWELRKDMAGLFLEEQLQQYERLLGLLDKELLVDATEKGDDGSWIIKTDADGDIIRVVDQGILDKMLSIMDKVNELKGLKQPAVLVGVNTGNNGTVSVGKDAAAARELLDCLKSGKVGNGKAPSSPE